MSRSQVKVKVVGQANAVGLTSIEGSFFPVTNVANRSGRLMVYSVQLRSTAVNCW